MADLADEIVIVDTGSTDRTVSIVREYTDRIYHFRWIDDFAAARNYSFSLAEKEYILWLDADDVFEEPDRIKFAALKKKLDSSVDAVNMNYNLSFGEHELAHRQNETVLEYRPGDRQALANKTCLEGVLAGNTETPAD